MGRPVAHFEIGCRDSRKTQEFFANLFDRKIELSGPAAMVSTGGNGGIGGHITSLGHEPHNYVTFYVEVEDIAAFLHKVESLGGKTLVPAVKIPSGQFAWSADPDGNIVGLLKRQ